MIVIEVDSWSVGDIVHIYGLEGVVDSPWVQSGSSYTFTLTNANLLNATHISIPLSYNNPTFITTNAITSVEISRPSLSLVYASIALQLDVCDVSSVITLATLSVSMSASTIYTASNYIISFIPSLNDYTSADRI